MYDLNLEDYKVTAYYMSDNHCATHFISNINIFVNTKQTFLSDKLIFYDNRLKQRCFRVLFGIQKIYF